MTSLLVSIAILIAFIAIVGGLSWDLIRHSDGLGWTAHDDLAVERLLRDPH